MQTETYWGMTLNPFTKELDVKDIFESEDMRQMSQRLEHLRNYPGIGLFTAPSGYGKSLALRKFTARLNPNLYKVVYTPFTSISESDFFRIVAERFGLEPAYRRGANISNINERMTRLCKDQKIMPILIIDEAQNIRSAGFFQSLQAMMNFEIDYRNYCILILSGEVDLNNTLDRGQNQAFAQRITINYDFQGLSFEETSEYIRTRMALANAASSIFDPAAIESAYECCQGSVRKLNSIISTALLIGCNEKARSVSAEFIRQAALEVSLIK